MRLRRFTSMALGGLALSGFLATAGPAAAEYDQYRYNRDFQHGYDRDSQRGGARQQFEQRQVRMHQLIQHGVQTGALTPSEFDYVNRQQANIREMERQYLADGQIDQWEWRELERAQDQANSSIEVYMNNGDRRLALSGILATAGPAARQQFEQRQVRMHQLIQHGAQTGALTPSEFDYVNRQQANIREMERQYLADGQIDQWEWRELERAQDQANSSIQEYMNNGAQRYSSYR